MPVKIEKALRKTAKKRRYNKEQTDRYVYGGLRKTGWVPSREKK
jgi:hypothetical protein